MRAYDSTNWSHDSNKMMMALCSYLRQEITQRIDEISEPEHIEDLAKEWIALHGERFRGCHPEWVLFMYGSFMTPNPVRVFRIDYLSAHQLMAKPIFWVMFKPDSPDFYADPQE